MSVLDISNHDYSTFAPQCFADNGVTRAIVGCWERELSEDMVRRNRAVGIASEDLYAYLYYGQPWERRELDNALSIAAELGGIERIWLDCEADPPNEAVGMTPGQRVARTMSAARTVELAGIEADIYTYEPYWLTKMANTTAFSDRKLWLANYGWNDPAAPRPPITTVNFGGWATVSAHQYSSTIWLCGRRRDHNYWFLEEDDEMSEEDRQRIARLERIVAGNGIDLDGDNYADTFGEDALRHADERGWSSFLGVSIARQDLATHMAANPDGDVPDHSHGGVER